MSFLAQLPPRYHPYLEQAKNRIDVESINRVREQRIRALQHNETLYPFAAAWQPFASFKSSHLRFDRAVVEIGHADELSAEQQEKFASALRTFIPWKKGPFRLFGHEIASEWQSQLKWERIVPHLPNLRGKKIADIGCHNGYYMFRAAALDPALVLGFEPNPKLWCNFHLLQRYAQVPSLAFELLGIEELNLYPDFFQVIFCLGILYHHPDPLRHLQAMHRSLTRGGRIVIDCQGIPGEEPVALLPAARYAGAKGIWWLPTLSCLTNLLQRCNFKEISCIYAAKLEPSEQRATPWAPLASLEDFLDPEDSTKTREGYPAPWRFYLIAKK
jgi:tRNA (mo5U34)-methyltransferase